MPLDGNDPQVIKTKSLLKRRLFLLWRGGRECPSMGFKPGKRKDTLSGALAGRQVSNIIPRWDTRLKVKQRLPRSEEHTSES
jgi:hypothetical protein